MCLGEFQGMQCAERPDLYCLYWKLHMEMGIGDAKCGNIFTGSFTVNCSNTLTNLSSKGGRPPR